MAGLAAITPQQTLDSYTELCLCTVPFLQIILPPKVGDSKSFSKRETPHQQELVGGSVIPSVRPDYGRMAMTGTMKEYLEAYCLKAPRVFSLVPGSIPSMVQVAPSRVGNRRALIAPALGASSPYSLDLNERIAATDKNAPTS